MSGNMDPVTLIFLVVAIIVGLKLRSVLGQSDDDDDRGPMDGYGPRKTDDQRTEQQQGGSDNVVTLPTRTAPADQQDQAQPGHEVKKSINMADQINKYAQKGSPLEQGLKDIVAVDQNFEPENFFNGAKTAYEMIVMAFAEGNRKLLKQLLAKDVYEGFLGAIDAREKKNLIVNSSFVGIDAAEFVNAELRGGRTARITIKFVSALITSTHNREGDVIDGDPKKVREVTDIWTFARDTNSKDPNWQLVATESAS